MAASRRIGITSGGIPEADGDFSECDGARDRGVPACHQRDRPREAVDHPGHVDQVRGLFRAVGRVLAWVAGRMRLPQDSGREARTRGGDPAGFDLDGDVLTPQVLVPDRRARLLRYSPGSTATFRRPHQAKEGGCLSGPGIVLQPTDAGDWIPAFAGMMKWLWAASAWSTARPCGRA